MNDNINLIKNNINEFFSQYFEEFLKVLTSNLINNLEIQFSSFMVRNNSFKIYFVLGSGKYRS